MRWWHREHAEEFSIGAYGYYYKSMRASRFYAHTIQSYRLINRFFDGLVRGTEEMRLHKADIARRQIETALDLFFAQKDPVSVITLAGAGEEILGALLRRAGKLNMVDHLVALDKRLTDTGREFKVVNEEINRIRNSLKHANNPAEDEIEVDAEHAVAMLARAVANYTSLEVGATPLMQRFYEYLQALHPDVSP